MATPFITKRKIDTFGGVGSIFVGVFCAFIGWSDYTEGRSWHIWALMTIILIINGLAMLRQAARNARHAGELPAAAPSAVRAHH